MWKQNRYIPCLIYVWKNCPNSTWDFTTFYFAQPCRDGISNTVVKISEHSADMSRKYLKYWGVWAEFLLPPWTTNKDSHLTQQTNINLATHRLHPVPTNPDTKENPVAVRRYLIDFLMKHNIAFSCPLFFSAIVLTHTHKHTQNRKSI